MNKRNIFFLLIILYGNAVAAYWDMRDVIVGLVVGTALGVSVCRDLYQKHCTDILMAARTPEQVMQDAENFYLTVISADPESLRPLFLLEPIIWKLSDHIVWVKAIHTTQAETLKANLNQLKINLEKLRLSIKSFDKSLFKMAPKVLAC